MTDEELSPEQKALRVASCITTFYEAATMLQIGLFTTLSNFDWESGLDEESRDDFRQGMATLSQALVKLQELSGRINEANGQSNGEPAAE